MKTKLDAADKFFEALAIISVLATLGIVAISYRELPDIIPNHFDLNGVPNQYGSKTTLWMVVAISVFLYMLTGIIGMFPESFNYPSQKNDKEAQYKLGAKFMRSLRASVLLFIAIVSCMVVNSAKTGSAKGSVWLILLIFSIIAGHLIWFFIQWKKIK